MLCLAVFSCIIIIIIICVWAVFGLCLGCVWGVLRSLLGVALTPHMPYRPHMPCLAVFGLCLVCLDMFGRNK